MSEALVKRLLLSKTKPLQLLIALFGALLGLFIVMGGIQVYRYMQALMTQKDMLAGDFIVINKKVGLLNSISGTTPGFSQDEIQAVSAIKGIDNVGAFTAGNFRSMLELDPQMAQVAGPAFKTDMFFESVPGDFVDIDAQKWKWKPGDATVPIIIPSDYIKLYNMAFAQSQGLPVIPESMLESITLKLRLRGQGKEELLDARIAGFSERINSILVPASFVAWGNEHYGNGEARKPSRLILHTSDPTSPSLAASLQSLGYELNEEKLRSSRINSVLQIILTIVAFIGGLIVVLALLGFIQYNQLLAYRSAYEIQTLHWLGFKVKQLSFPYIRFIFLSIFITLLVAIAATWLGHWWVGGFLQSKGFEAEMPSPFSAIVTGIVISLLMATISAFAAHRQVARLAR